MSPHTLTIAQHPDLEHAANQLDQLWPAFLTESDISGPLWHHLYTTFAEFQLLVMDGDEIIARGNTIPLLWDGTVETLPSGLDGVVTTATRQREAGIQPNTLSATAALVSRTHQGTGLSSFVINAMRTLASEHGFLRLIAPVRPNQKHHYPLISMDDYITWVRQDGLPFDNWIRVHIRSGATLLKIARESMLVTGSVHQWERWTGLAMPGSGQYVVPGALVPVAIDRETDRGTYLEPNVWMTHPVDAP
jgi:hypothetical protein